MDGSTLLFWLTLSASVVGLVAISLYMACQRVSRSGDPGDQRRI